MTLRILRKIYAASFGSALLLSVSPANAILIDFEIPAVADQTNLAVSVVSEDGFDLTLISGDFQLYPVNSNVNVPESGSQSLLLNAGSPASFTLTNALGDSFDLASLRASEGRNQGGFFDNFSATGITIEGFFSGGGSITTTFNFDLNASDNGATDFELISLVGFSGLSSATFTGFGGNNPGYSFGIDDITVQVATAVAEPGPLALLGLGFAALGFAYCRKIPMRQNPELPADAARPC